MGISGGGWEDRTPTSCLQSTCAPIITNPPILAPKVGIEPTTNRLTVCCTTAVLLWNKTLVPHDRIELPLPDYKTGVLPFN